MLPHLVCVGHARALGSPFPAELLMSVLTWGGRDAFQSIHTQAVLASSPGQPLPPHPAPPVPMGRCSGAGVSGKGTGQTGLAQRKVSPGVLAVSSSPWSAEKALSAQQASCPVFKELKGRVKK